MKSRTKRRKPTVDLIKPTATNVFVPLGNKIIIIIVANKTSIRTVGDSFHNKLDKRFILLLKVKQSS